MRHDEANRHLLSHCGSKVTVVNRNVEERTVRRFQFLVVLVDEFGNSVTEPAFLTSRVP